MLVGGLAVAAQGQPRATADVDLMIAVDISRALSLVKELATSPFRPLFDDIATVVETSFILPLRHRTTNVKVDVAIGLSGFECQAISRAQQLELLGVTLPVATAEDLIIMKVLAGRPQDDQDVRGLAIAQGDRLDWDYCLRVGANWVRQSVRIWPAEFEFCEILATPNPDFAAIRSFEARNSHDFYPRFMRSLHAAGMILPVEPDSSLPRESSPETTTQAESSARTFSAACLPSLTPPLLEKHQANKGGRSP